MRRNIGQPRTLLPLSRSWFKGTLLEAHWPYRRGQVMRALIRVSFRGVEILGMALVHTQKYTIDLCTEMCTNKA
ncbi:hypothetical protein DM56_2298 [Burkholderia mallei]|nr:hypothetical protein DM56_2298 [Burkholderia mallei]KOT22232.1 hypothetical protein DM52_2514 [Burkholderia mallei]